ncbi:hypothetical protein IGI39_004906 [Enterococcus sp. AZ135]|uniref:hypothetical protein n=1 Tax=unclassified Enterococcus TaxID=2608891 RepID=UPI003F1EC05F
MDELIKAHNAVFGFEIVDGKIEPPKYNLPKAVEDRINYFGKQSEDGLSFFGCISAILAYDDEECKKQYQLGAVEEWLPMTEEARQWFNQMGTPGEMLVVVKLLYGLRSEWNVGENV